MSTTDTTRRPVENWRDIPGYAGVYQVSDQGRVRTTGRWVNAVTNGWRRWMPPAVLTPRPSGSGGRYRSVVLSMAGRRASRSVHSLVLEAFVGPRPAGMLGCHGDDIGTNNVLENLRWDTPTANAADRDRRRRSAA